MIFSASQQFTTLLGLLTIVPSGHGAVCFMLEETVIYVDPYSATTDYSKYPKADIIFFTHDHQDHYDVKALEHLVTPKTVFVGPECMEEHIKLEKTLRNGDAYTWRGIEIKAVPAYNIINKRQDGNPFHPKGYGNGYIFTFGDFRVYLAGDTEFIPEMETYGPVDVAILPKNLPYTMSDEQFVQAVKVLGAPVVYPVHYFELDREKLEKAVGDDVKLIYQ
ncbi:MAG: MBL fold metallo-hydrolase [Bacteroidales bacterium]|nr:MBL fold metallo-hydrolase [Bacteroidales bacterium]MDD4501316.1 MBL fold metallo-hydrolase [Bacteroidales bacterium]